MAKILICILAAIHTSLGIRNMLNVLGFLHSSKYSPISTLVFGILFLCMGGLALYFLFVKQQVRTAMWISLGPWLLGLVIMLCQLVTSKYP